MLCSREVLPRDFFEFKFFIPGLQLRVLQARPQCSKDSMNAFCAMSLPDLLSIRGDTCNILTSESDIAFDVCEKEN